MRFKKNSSRKNKRQSYKKKSYEGAVISSKVKTIEKFVFRPEHRKTPPHIRAKLKEMKKDCEYSDTVIFSNAL